MNYLQYLLCAVLIVNSTHIIAAGKEKSCAELHDNVGSYTYSHSVPIGNGMHECFEKPKEGKGDPIKFSVSYASTQDEPTSKDAGGAKSSASTSNPAATGKNCPADSLTDENRAALKQWMGKKFSDIPAFHGHWMGAAQNKLAAVSDLKPDSSTNSDNRTDFFDPARKKFWRLVYRDTSANGARKLIENAGGWFDKAGNAPMIKINGVIQRLNVDHIVSLAVEPSRMLDPSNLRLISAIENQKALEEIKHKDPFQSPEAADSWMQKQEQCK